ncbi:carboxypeptidase B isoform X2 [Rhipicephalus sanguineus]|uniref:carboxypeptidase B isoform X2 n=1 Tax=Rhipicephalus sanguineus TaxID=34632 RepID=UPI0020C481B9|nr:carboxypeptidase B isoform X2 [Rhipicephalus sanguineus]
MLLLLLCALLASATTRGAEPPQGPDGKVHFDGYTVYRLYPKDVQQLKYLADLENSEIDGFDFWLEPSRVHRFVDVSVSPNKQRQFLDQLHWRDIPSEVLIHDLEQEINNSTTSRSDVPDLRSPRSFFSDYQRLNTLSSGRAKRAVWLDGGMHAREWISPATVMYILEELVSGYSNDNDTTKILDTFDVYGLPVANPDGYEYTHILNRLWRKTRSTTASFICRGADPNRNFGFKWSSGGSSSKACSEVFAGNKAFSEPETKAIANFVYARRREIMAFLTFHSYSQLWLTPWGYTALKPANYLELARAARVATAALEKVHGTKYNVGTSTSMLYVASGGSDDWALGEAQIPYAYTVELRDTGRHGFTLPRDQIVPTGEETWAGIKALLLELASKVDEGT